GTSHLWQGNHFVHCEGRVLVVFHELPFEYSQDCRAFGGRRAFEEFGQTRGARRHESFRSARASEARRGHRYARFERRWAWHSPTPRAHARPGFLEAHFHEKRSGIVGIARAELAVIAEAHGE